MSVNLNPSQIQQLKAAVQTLQSEIGNLEWNYNDKNSKYDTAINKVFTACEQLNTILQNQNFPFAQPLLDRISEARKIQNKTLFQASIRKVVDAFSSIQNKFELHVGSSAGNSAANAALNRSGKPEADEKSGKEADAKNQRETDTELLDKLMTALDSGDIDEYQKAELYLQRMPFGEVKEAAALRLATLYKELTLYEAVLRPFASMPFQMLSPSSKAFITEFNQFLSDLVQVEIGNKDFDEAFRYCSYMTDESLVVQILKTIPSEDKVKLLAACKDENKNFKVDCLDRAYLLIRNTDNNQSELMQLLKACDPKKDGELAQKIRNIMLRLNANRFEAARVKLIAEMTKEIQQPTLFFDKLKDLILRFEKLVDLRNPISKIIEEIDRVYDKFNLETAFPEESHNQRLLFAKNQLLETLRDIARFEDQNLQNDFMIELKKDIDALIKIISPKPQSKPQNLSYAGSPTEVLIGIDEKLEAFSAQKGVEFYAELVKLEKYLKTKNKFNSFPEIAPLLAVVTKVIQEMEPDLWKSKDLSKNKQFYLRVEEEFKKLISIWMPSWKKPLVKAPTNPLMSELKLKTILGLVSKILLSENSRDDFFFNVAELRSSLLNAGDAAIIKKFIDILEEPLKNIANPQYDIKASCVEIDNGFKQLEMYCGFALKVSREADTKTHHSNANTDEDMQISIVGQISLGKYHEAFQLCKKVRDAHLLNDLIKMIPHEERQKLLDGFKDAHSNFKEEYLDDAFRLILSMDGNQTALLKLLEDCTVAGNTRVANSIRLVIPKQSQQDLKHQASKAGGAITSQSLKDLNVIIEEMADTAGRKDLNFVILCQDLESALKKYEPKSQEKANVLLAEIESFFAETLGQPKPQCKLSKYYLRIVAAFNALKVAIEDKEKLLFIPENSLMKPKDHERLENAITGLVVASKKISKEFGSHCDVIFDMVDRSTDDDMAGLRDAWRKIYEEINKGDRSLRTNRYLEHFAEISEQIVQLKLVLDKHKLSPLNADAIQSLKRYVHLIDNSKIGGKNASSRDFLSNLGLLLDRLPKYKNNNGILDKMWSVLEEMKGLHMSNQGFGQWEHYSAGHSAKLLQAFGQLEKDFAMLPVPSTNSSVFVGGPAKSSASSSRSSEVEAKERESKERSSGGQSSVPSFKSMTTSGQPQVSFEYTRVEELITEAMSMVTNVDGFFAKIFDLQEYLKKNEGVGRLRELLEVVDEIGLNLDVMPKEVANRIGYVFNSLKTETAVRVPPGHSAYLEEDLKDNHSKVSDPRNGDKLKELKLFIEKMVEADKTGKKEQQVLFPKNSLMNSQQLESLEDAVRKMFVASAKTSGEKDRAPALKEFNASFKAILKMLEPIVKVKKVYNDLLQIREDVQDKHQKYTPRDIYIRRFDMILEQIVELKLILEMHKPAEFDGAAVQVIGDCIDRIERVKKDSKDSSYNDFQEAFIELFNILKNYKNVTVLKNLRCLVEIMHLNYNQFGPGTGKDRIWLEYSAKSETQGSVNSSQLVNAFEQLKKDFALLTGSPVTFSGVVGGTSIKPSETSSGRSSESDSKVRASVSTIASTENSLIDMGLFAEATKLMVAMGQSAAPKTMDVFYRTIRDLLELMPKFNDLERHILEQLRSKLQNIKDKVSHWNPNELADYYNQILKIFNEVEEVLGLPPTKSSAVAAGLKPALAPSDKADSKLGTTEPA